MIHRPLRPINGQTELLSMRELLVQSRRSLPVDHIIELPRVLSQIPLQFSLLIHNKLGCRVQHTSTLTFVLIIDLHDASREIEGLRLRVKPGLTESDPTIRNKNDFSSGGRWNHLDVGAVRTERACYFHVAYRSHLLQCVDQTLILAFLKRLHENLPVRRRRKFVNVQGYADVRTHLLACTKGCGIDGLVLFPRKTQNAPSSYQKEDQQAVDSECQWLRYLAHMLLLWQSAANRSSGVIPDKSASSNPQRVANTFGIETTAIFHLPSEPSLIVRRSGDQTINGRNNMSRSGRSELSQV